MKQGSTVVSPIVGDFTSIQPDIDFIILDCKILERSACRWFDDSLSAVFSQMCLQWGYLILVSPECSLRCSGGAHWRENIGSGIFYFKVTYNMNYGRTYQLFSSNQQDLYAYSSTSSQKAE